MGVAEELFVAIIVSVLVYHFTSNPTSLLHGRVVLYWN